MILTPASLSCHVMSCHTMLCVCMCVCLLCLLCVCVVFFLSATKLSADLFYCNANFSRYNGHSANSWFFLCLCFSPFALFYWSNISRFEKTSCADLYICLRKEHTNISTGYTSISIYFYLQMDCNVWCYFWSTIDRKYQKSAYFPSALLFQSVIRPITF